MKFDLDEMYRMTVILIICMLSFIVVKSCIQKLPDRYDSSELYVNGYK